MWVQVRFGMGCCHCWLAKAAHTSTSLNAGSASERYLTYKLNRNFKIFAGYKLFETSDNQEDNAFGKESITVTDPYVGTGDWMPTFNTSNGPALGISYSIPILDYTAVTLSSSIFYAWSELEVNKYYESVTNTIAAERFSYSYTGLGNNSTITLSYFIEPISTAVSLGGRFQIIKYFADADSPSLENDYFYGLTASVMFIF